jgi:hypothetical protein
MRRIIAAINLTVDGVCDHTAGIPDEENIIITLTSYMNYKRKNNER